jgi:hypothetical protein
MTCEHRRPCGRKRQSPWRLVLALLALAVVVVISVAGLPDCDVPRPATPADALPSTEDAAAEWAKQQPYLAKTHTPKGKGCTDCHGNDRVLTDNETELNRACIKCHGNLAEMARSTEGPFNPHRSHLGAINCTTCHAGHVSSRAY